MTDLVKQLEDKKKGCGCSLRIVDLGLGEEIFICNSKELCKTCKSNVAILEQAIAEKNEFIELLKKEFLISKFDENFKFQISRKEIYDIIDKVKNIQSQQTKPLEFVETDRGCKPISLTGITRCNSSKDKTADISNLLQKQRQEIIEEIDKFLTSEFIFDNNWEKKYREVIRVLINLKEQLNQPKAEE